VRLRTAIPLLVASFAVMVTGLGLAHAQQGDDEEDNADQDSIRVPPGRNQVGDDPSVSEAVQRARERRRQLLQGRRNNAQEVAPVRPRRAQADQQRGGGDDDGPGEGELPAEIEPFESGVDYRPTPPGARVTFNLEDADLPDLVRLISTITGRRFILPGKVRSIKASVFAPTKVTAAEAYQAFLSILELNGMTVVPSGRYLKIVETGGIESEPITTYTGESPTPRGDRYLTRLHEVNHISADDAATLLSRFKTTEGNVTAYAPTNTLILTDTGSNIRRMLRILEAVDLPRTGEQIWIEPVYYANASEIADRLAEIFPVGERGGGSSGASAGSDSSSRSARARAAARRRRSRSSDDDDAATVGTRSSGSRISKILPDERTNSLVILATEGAYVRVLELIRRLDVPLEGDGRIHVHYIQNGDAEEIAGTLQSLIGGSSGRTASRGGQRGGQSGAAASATAAAGGGDVFEGQIRITAHTPTNALVITSSVQDYAALRRVIDRLDAPQRQVFIEAVIMELSVTRSNSLGLSFHVGAEGPVDGALALAGFQAGNTATPSLSPELLTGLALGVRGPDIPRSQELIGISVPGFGVAINALASSGDANVLSTPHVIALNNVQAEITVGENVPLQTSGIPTGAFGGLGALAGAQGQTGQAAGLGNLAAGGFAGAGGIPRQDIGTTIRITPHINESDEIRLEIEEEISERGATEGTLGVVSITKRTATTELVVRDQQTVVIGGLMRDTVTTSEDKVPVLGDIPILGALFRDTTTSTQKTNLLLFLTPYIIRGPEDLRSIYERKMRERQEFIDRYFVFGDQEYQPAIDYGRTRGLVSEIINEVDAVLEEEALLAEAQAQPPPEHIPRPPVGEGVEFEEELEDGDVVITPESVAPQESEPEDDEEREDG